jgi:hypothetical protein
MRNRQEERQQEQQQRYQSAGWQQGGRREEPSRRAGVGGNGQDYSEGYDEFRSRDEGSRMAGWDDGRADDRRQRADEWHRDHEWQPGQQGVDQRTWRQGDQRGMPEARDARGRFTGHARGPHSGKGPKGYTRSDDRIREEISDALMAHGDIDASDIEVEVTDGQVTLSGSVDSRETKRAAEDLIEDVQGVADVQNSLRVAGRGQGDHNGSRDSAFDAGVTSRAQRSANGQRNRGSRGKRKTRQSRHTSK